MALRIIINACTRNLCHSLAVDSNKIMTKKKILIFPQYVNRIMATRFCTESSLKTAQLSDQESQQSDSESDTELGLLKSDAEEITQPKTIKFLVVGLGNTDHQRTRHSVGMQFVDRVANRLGATWTKEKYKLTGGFTASAQLDNNVQIHLLKPRVPMNLSGTSVVKSARFYSMDTENIYLVHDELDKPVGDFHMKEGGSANGHNGVKSVMNSLKSEVMPRLRIGIDCPTDKDSVVDYVLEKFTLDEHKLIRGTIDESIRHLFQHMGNKCGVKIDVTSQKYTTQKWDDDSEKEQQYSFGKSHKYKNSYRNDRGNYRNKNDNQDYPFEDRRGFRYQDDKRDFRQNRRNQMYFDEE